MEFVREESGQCGDGKREKDEKELRERRRRDKIKEGKR